MQGNLKKRGKASYRIRIDLGRDASGRRRWYTETVRGTKPVAEGRLVELLGQHNRGALAQASKMPLGQYLDRWVSDSLEGTVSKRTFADYQDILRRYVRDELGHVRLSDLSPMQVQKLYRGMASRGLSARTIKYVHNVLGRALKQAERWGMVPRNVVALVDVPKMPRAKTPRSLDFDQAARFIEAALADRFAAMWLLALDTGMRPEEYLALRWSDLDLDRRTVRVERVVCRNRKGGGYYFDEPKTPESRRVIEFSDTVARALRAHRQAQSVERLAGRRRRSEEDLVFATTTGTPLHYPNLHRRHFKKILEKAKLPQTVRIYDLRHSCATLLGASGVRAKVIQERLGHSSTKTTLDLYSHVLPSEQGVASSVMDREVFGKKPRQGSAE